MGAGEKLKELEERVVDADVAFKKVRKLVGYGWKVTVEHVVLSESPQGYYLVEWYRPNS